MYINKVISYKNAWGVVSNKYPTELSEIQSALDDLFAENAEPGAQSERPNPRLAWEKAMYDRGWELIDRTHYSTDGKRINLGRLGPTKSGLSAACSFGTFDYISRWLFQQSTLAIRHGLIKIPIMLVPVYSFSRG